MEHRHHHIVTKRTIERRAEEKKLLNKCVFHEFSTCDCAGACTRVGEWIRVPITFICHFSTSHTHTRACSTLTQKRIKSFFLGYVGYNVNSFLLQQTWRTYAHADTHKVGNFHFLFYRNNLVHFVCRTAAANSTFTKFILSLTSLRFMCKSFCLIFFVFFFFSVFSPPSLCHSSILCSLHISTVSQRTRLSKELWIFGVQFFCHLFSCKHSVRCAFKMRNGII